MGLFDSIMRSAGNAIKNETAKAVSNTASSVGKGSNRSESFTFAALPNNVAELQALPEATLDSAFKTTALTIAALCAYEKDPDACIEMLNFLKGPAEVSTYEKGFIKERLNGKFYKTFSFFEGATPQNGYKPTTPYVIKVSENPYSFDEENWATLYVTSGGADNPRPIKLRKKPSTGQWFLNDIQCLADIRIPTADDPWA
ncbi:MAG: hypothetical protein E7478_09800 [Ruminococcaceae bacterium]|nr:hypothetical protein [Oscillospiraceae bacterium]